MSDNPSNVSARTAVVGALPLVCLHQANLMDHLRRRYERVVTTSAVAHEVERRRQTGVYAPRLADYPWIEVLPSAPGSEPLAVEEELTGLLELSSAVADPILIVEYRHERKTCDRHKRQSTGLIGLLLMLKKLGMVESVGARLPLLSEAGLLISKRSYQMALIMAGEA